MSIRFVTLNPQQYQNVSYEQHVKELTQPTIYPKQNIPDVDYSLSGMPEDVIINMCHDMTISELQAFIIISRRNANLCNNILRDLKLQLKSVIVKDYNNIWSGCIMDASKYLSEINYYDVPYFHYPDFNLVDVPNYPRLYIRKSKLPLLLDILNTA